MDFVGKGNAKLILFGEHAVVHGHPALGIGLPGQLTVSWTPGDSQLVLACPEEYQSSIRLAFQRIAGFFGFDGSPEANRLAWPYAPAGACRPAETSGSVGPGVGFQHALPGGLLEFESSIPVSAGLGSSGAVCVAMARVLAAFAAYEAGAAPMDQGHADIPGDQAIWAAAHGGEQVFHGRPSGVDTGLALWRRLCLFTPQPGSLPAVSFLPGAGIELVYGTVPREASCAANVAAIGKAMSAGDTGVSAALAELGRLSSQAATVLGHASTAASRLGGLANTAMDRIRSLGLSTPAMDAVLAAGLAAGATGGKLSGGGAGGAFWLACSSKSEAQRVQNVVIVEARRLGVPGEACTGVITI